MGMSYVLLSIVNSMAEAFTVPKTKTIATSIEIRIAHPPCFDPIDVPASIHQMTRNVLKIYHKSPAATSDVRSIPTAAHAPMQ